MFTMQIYYVQVESGVSMDVYRLYCRNKVNRYYSHKLTKSTEENLKLL